MILQCLTWIPYLWGRLVDSFVIHRRFAITLPDDVLIDILSRLPAERVLTCQMVCKKWTELTSTSYFAQLHLKRSIPIIFIQDVNVGSMLNYELDLFMFDEEAEKDQRVKKLHLRSAPMMSRTWPVLTHSCDGLLLFQPKTCGYIFFVCNPITQEHITVRAPFGVHLCGFFFHSFTRQYRLLCVHNQGDCFRFVVHSLGSKVWRQVATLSYWPPGSGSSVIVNGALHWILEHQYELEFNKPTCSNSIMVFNIDKEDLLTMPHPGSKCMSRLSNGKRFLLKMNEQLSLCHLYGKVIKIWVLKDRANWNWVKKYVVNLDCVVRLYPFNSNYVNKDITLLNIENDELLFAWYGRGLFRCNLRLDTIRKIQVKEKFHKLLKNHFVSASYVKSFISLRGS